MIYDSASEEKSCFIKDCVEWKILEEILQEVAFHPHEWEDGSAVHERKRGGRGCGGGEGTVCGQLYRAERRRVSFRKWLAQQWPLVAL